MVGISSNVLVTGSGSALEFAVAVARTIRQTPAEAIRRLTWISPVAGGSGGSRCMSISSAGFARWRAFAREAEGTSKGIKRREYHKQLVQHAEVLKEKTRAVDFIKNNMILNNDGIVAISKPCGLGVSGKGTTEEGVSSPLTLSSLMPEVADMINMPAVEIAQGIEKEASGLVLLGENKAIVEELKSCLAEARKKHQFMRTYRAISCGIPTQKEGVIKTYLGNDNINGNQMTMVRHDPPRKQIKKGEVVSSETKYRVISVNRDLNCALMELQPLRVRRHQLQVHLTNLLCPVLGDHIYSHQVRTILGVPMLMDPYKVPPTQTIQVLNPEMRKALSLTNRQVSLLPLFLHHHRIIIPEWRGKGDVELVAPDPAHFWRALQMLGLEDGLTSHVKCIECGR